jgi:integrase
LFSDLRREEIFGFYIDLKKERSLSNKTLRHYHHLLCVLGDHYAEIVPAAENPLRKIKDFTKRFPLQPPTRDIGFLLPEEIDRLLKELKRSPSPLIYPFVKFLAHSGLRRSEALNLKWTDIDRAEGFIYVRKSKTNRSRTVPLENEAWEAIEVLKGNSDFVFATIDGVRYYVDSFLKPLKRAAKRAGITKRVDIHMFRHSFGSNKIRMGWGIKKVSLLLGHADISTTSRIYTHYLDGDMKVRDDFVFDKRSNQVNLEVLGPRSEEENKVASIFMNFTKALEKVSASQLKTEAFTKALAKEVQQGIMKPTLVESKATNTIGSITGARL